MREATRALLKANIKAVGGGACAGVELSTGIDLRRARRAIMKSRGWCVSGGRVPASANYSCPEARRSSTLRNLH